MSVNGGRGWSNKAARKRTPGPALGRIDSSPHLKWGWQGRSPSWDAKVDLVGGFRDEVEIAGLAEIPIGRGTRAFAGRCSDAGYGGKEASQEDGRSKHEWKVNGQGQQGSGDPELAERPQELSQELKIAA